MAWKDYIVADPEVLGGKPIIKGTRISVEFVVQRLAQGWTETESRISFWSERNHYRHKHCFHLIGDTCGLIAGALKSSQGRLSTVLGPRPA